MLIKLPGHKKPWVIEIKNGLVPKLEAGYHRACEIIKPEHQFVVYGGKECFRLTREAEAISVTELCRKIENS